MNATNSVGKLRTYQRESVDAIANARAAGVGAVLVCLATGLGKTHVLAALPNRLQTKGRETMLVVAHRDELIAQTRDKFAGFDPTLRIGIEQGDLRASAMDDVVVASLMTLKGDRLDDFVRRFISRISVTAIDEAHHSTAATYRDIIAAFPRAFVVGVTATPNRSDGVGLGAVYDQIVYNLDIRWGINNGYLTPVRSYIARSRDTSIDHVETRAGDYARDQLGEVVDTGRRNALAIKTYLETSRGKKAIVYCATVRHAIHLAEAFGDVGITAHAIHGKTPEEIRRRVIRDFRSGAVSVLTNCDVLIEGFDVPDVEVIINARPTKSSLKYTQITGRGIRPHDSVAKLVSAETSAAARCAIIASSPKPVATVIDIIDGDKPKAQIQTLASLWGLPLDFDAKGVEMRAVVEEYEKAAARNPVRAREAHSFEDLHLAIQEVDTFAPPSLDPTVAANSKNLWLATAGGGYRVTLPPAYVPVGVDAQHLNAERQRIGDLIRKAIREGMPDPIEAVAQAEGRRIATIDEWIQIAESLLGRWEVNVHQTVRIDGATTERSKKIADENTVDAAFRCADQWLIKERADHLRIIKREAKWRSEPRSKPQERQLKLYGVPEHLWPQTKGDANTLLTRLANERRDAKPERPAWEGEEVSPGQKWFFISRGLQAPATKGEARRQIGHIRRRETAAARQAFEAENAAS